MYIIMWTTSPTGVEPSDPCLSLNTSKENKSKTTRNNKKNMEKTKNTREKVTIVRVAVNYSPTEK